MKATVSSIEQAFTSSGAEYKKLKVMDENGKETTKTVFDNLQDKWSLLTEGAYLEFKMEKRGQFWNVIDILPLEEPPQVAPKGSEPPLVEKAKKLDEKAGEMTKEDWAIKAALTRKSIERQKSLELAIQSMSSLGEFEPENIIKQAQRFERYIETGK